jgi:hypothetical protein
VSLGKDEVYLLEGATGNLGVEVPEDWEEEGVEDGKEAFVSC